MQSRTRARWSRSVPLATISRVQPGAELTVHTSWLLTGQTRGSRRGGSPMPSFKLPGPKFHVRQTCPASQPVQARVSAPPLAAVITSTVHVCCDLSAHAYSVQASSRVPRAALVCLPLPKRMAVYQVPAADSILLPLALPDLPQGSLPSAQRSDQTPL